MIHFQKGHRGHYYDRDHEFKILCLENRWQPMSSLNNIKPTAVSHNVTCLKCLEILIPRKQKELEKMLNARAEAQAYSNAHKTLNPNNEVKNEHVNG